MQHRGLADPPEHQNKSEVSAEDLDAPPNSGIRIDIIRIATIEEKVVHVRIASVHIIYIGGSRDVGLSEFFVLFGAPLHQMARCTRSRSETLRVRCHAILSRRKKVESAIMTIITYSQLGVAVHINTSALVPCHALNLAGCKLPIAIPGPNDQHTHWLGTDTDTCDQKQVYWPILIPVVGGNLLSIPHHEFALLPNIPVSKLHDVEHESQHHCNLNAVEERDKTPIDIRRRNSEDCPNEDRPASAAHQSRDGGDQ